MSVRPSVHPYVRPSVHKTLHRFQWNLVCIVCRGRWVTHDGMQYDTIQGQGQGPEPLKLESRKFGHFKRLSPPHLQRGLATDHGLLKRTIPKAYRAGFFFKFLFYFLCHVTFKLAISRSRPPVPYGVNLLFFIWFFSFRFSCYGQT